LTPRIPLWEIFLQKKKKKDVGEIEGLGEGRKGRMKKEEEEEEEEGRRRRRRRRKGRRRRGRRSKGLANCFAKKNRRMALSNFF